MTLTEKNEVIAKFMGGDFNSKLDFVYFELPINKGYQTINLKYHSSFEWLMPACQKFCIETINSSEQYAVTIMHITNKYLTGRATIIDIHQALFEGIEWLNKQKQ